MANEKNIRIEKLSDTSLENVAGGGNLWSPTASRRIQTGGEVVAAVGMLGYGVCKIAGSVCEAKGIGAAKHLKSASELCKGLTALGGTTYLIGKLG